MGMEIWIDRTTLSEKDYQDRLFNIRQKLAGIVKQGRGLHRYEEIPGPDCARTRSWYTRSYDNWNIIEDAQFNRYDLIFINSLTGNYREKTWVCKDWDTGEFEAEYYDDETGFWEQVSHAVAVVEKLAAEVWKLPEDSMVRGVKTEMAKAEFLEKFPKNWREFEEYTGNMYKKLKDFNWSSQSLWENLTTEDIFEQVLVGKEWALVDTEIETKIFGRDEAGNAVDPDIRFLEENDIREHAELANDISDYRLTDGQTLLYWRRSNDMYDAACQIARRKGYPGGTGIEEIPEIPISLKDRGMYVPAMAENIGFTCRQAYLDKEDLAILKRADLYDTGVDGDWDEHPIDETPKEYMHRFRERRANWAKAEQALKDGYYLYMTVSL